MRIGPVGITKGELRAEPNGSGFNVWVGGTSRTDITKEEAIKFFESNTTPKQQGDKNAVVGWLEMQK